MITLEDGLVSCGRCVCGFQVGFIFRIERRTYSIRWLDGAETTQIRPDLDEDEDQTQEAA